MKAGDLVKVKLARNQIGQVIRIKGEGEDPPPIEVRLKDLSVVSFYEFELEKVIN